MDLEILPPRPYSELAYASNMVAMALTENVAETIEMICAENSTELSSSATSVGTEEVTRNQMAPVTFGMQGPNVTADVHENSNVAPQPESNEWVNTAFGWYPAPAPILMAPAASEAYQLQIPENANQVYFDMPSIFSSGEPPVPSTASGPHSVTDNGMQAGRQEESKANANQFELLMSEHSGQPDITKEL